MSQFPGGHATKRALARTFGRHLVVGQGSDTLAPLKRGCLVTENDSQTLSNHTRFDPWFHFFVLPVFGLGVILSFVHFFAHINEGEFRDHFHSFLIILLALALLVLAFKERLYALKVQDRVIRLEERLRLSAILPESQRAQIPQLTEDQLIGLRFASDAELPKLVELAVREKLSRKDIKKAIQNWRPDYWRV